METHTKECTDSVNVTPVNSYGTLDQDLGDDDPLEMTSDEGDRRLLTCGTNYEDAVAATGYGKFHYILLAMCGWALSSDAIEVLSISFVLPPASHPQELNLTSSDKGWLSAIIFVGMMIGGYMWGSLADIYGRRRVLLFSLTVNGLGGLASSFAQSFWLFFILRFVSGIGVGGSLPVIFSYYIEFQPKAKRGSMISLLATFWMSGSIICAGLAWIIIPRTYLNMVTPSFTYSSWRIFIAVCTAPAVSSALLFFLMPESPRYLLNYGQDERALQVLRRMFKLNNPKRNPLTDFSVTQLQIPATSKCLTDHIPAPEGKCAAGCHSFTSALSEFYRRELTSTVMGMNYVNVFCDGATDVSIKEQELMFMRSVHKGIITVRFLAIAHTPRPTAQSINDEVVQALRDAGMPDEARKHKLVGFAADGAAVMQLLRRTAELFRPPFTKLSIILVIIYFTLSFGYYGLFMWFPELFSRMERTGGSPCALGNMSTSVNTTSGEVGSKIYVESFITNASNLPGNILTFLVIDRIKNGRNILLATSMVVSGLCVFFIAMLKTKAESLIMSCIFSGISVIGWNALDVIGMELYPTHLRSTASGLEMGIGRIASILANVIFGELVVVQCLVPMFMVAGFMTVGGLSAFLLPNMQGKDVDRLSTSADT